MSIRPCWHICITKEAWETLLGMLFCADTFENRKLILEDSTFIASPIRKTLDVIMLKSNYIELVAKGAFSSPYA